MMRMAVSIALVALLTRAAIATGAEAKPATKVEVLQPQAGEALTGSVDVRVKITPVPAGRFPSVVYAGLGGPPWTRMERVGDTDQWRGRMDSSMVPNVRHNLIIKTTDKRAGAAAAVKVENPVKCFFADLHSHTGYSDGALVPADAHRYAREVAKLDVFSLTDHLESVDELEWSDTREVAQKANEPGRFVVIPGLEWTKGWGHVNIFEPQTRRWPDNPNEFYQALAKANVVAKFNHPGDGTKSHGGLAYSAAADRAIQMMEVRRPEEEQAFIRALSLGWHIAPDGSDDTHGPNWGSRFAWSGILAPGLSKRNVWHALKNRHLFSTLDRNCVLLLHVNGALMGSILEKPAGKVEIVTAVNESDDNDPIAKIELFEDGKVVQTDQPKSGNRRWETTCTATPGKHYYFVKVTQADGNLMWSAPVWVTVAGQ